MKKILFAFTILFAQNTFAQAIIIEKVKIEFERQVNVWAGLSGDFADRIKQNTPQYNSTFFNFESDGNKSLYSPVPQKETATSSRGFFMSSPASDNIVYSDFEKKSSVALKNVFEKSYMIEDSLRIAKWKITNDFREIAGYNCRRATTIIMDSIFVVAFYTDEIMIPGGPESFNGLPGMIMGLVINRLHTTWYATKVNVTGVNSSVIQPPAKSKAEKTSQKKLADILRSVFSNWGVNMEKNIWSVEI